LSSTKVEAQPAIVIRPHYRTDFSNSDPQNALSEAQGLAVALGLSVVHASVINIRKIIPATFIGGGVIESLLIKIKETNAKLLIIDADLSPVQQRNLETAMQVKVLDRTGLILEIFSLRALTKEGRLQVELARIVYERSRLVRTWTHLERQRGGKGFLAGPGERQIESDRRDLSDKAVALGRQLEKVRRTRRLHRKARKKRDCPIITLVGYTNAGKSTLFNRLTDANVFVQDMLFATLDPTIREVKLNQDLTAVLSDTVGFISNLPTELIAAFRATLEEVTEADLILHVRDIASPFSEEQRQNVEQVMAKLLEQSAKLPPVLEVWNKIDLTDSETREFLTAKAAKQETKPILISANTGEGLEELTAKMSDLLDAGHCVLQLTIPPGQSDAFDWIQRHGRILQCDAIEDSSDLDCVIKMDRPAFNKFKSTFPKLAPYICG